MPASFWRENVIVVVKVQILARMSWWRKQVIKYYKFNSLRSGEDLTTFKVHGSSLFRAIQVDTVYDGLQNQWVSK